MIICRTPLRISIGGGGTDLPSYYRQYGGFVIAAAINKYIFIGANRIFTKEYVVKYSSQERVANAADIQHPIFREAFQMLEVPPAVEVVSLADIPAGTGLGSSGSFTVGLVRTLHALRHEYVSAAQVAEEACHIEVDRLKQPSGKQDQYAASFGGVNCYEFDQEGKATVSKLKLSVEALGHLEDHLLTFFTGYSRSSETLLSDQKKKTEQGDGSMIDNLHFIKEIGTATRQALESNDFAGYGRLMHEHWLHKRKRSSGMSNASIDSWYEAGAKAGALGGKLIGAGGGGFLLFYTEEPRRLRDAMVQAGLEEVRFQFDHEGSTIISRN
jgi:D-glycero-alpha-D-manno-heptose-7-phosphate kinase